MTGIRWYICHLISCRLPPRRVCRLVSSAAWYSFHNSCIFQCKITQNSFNRSSRRVHSGCETILSKRWSPFGRFKRINLNIEELYKSDKIVNFKSKIKLFEHTLSFPTLRYFFLFAWKSTKRLHFLFLSTLWSINFCASSKNSRGKNHWSNSWQTRCNSVTHGGGSSLLAYKIYEQCFGKTVSNNRGVTNFCSVNKRKNLQLQRRLEQRAKDHAAASSRVLERHATPAISRCLLLRFRNLRIIYAERFHTANFREIRRSLAQRNVTQLRNVRDCAKTLPLIAHPTDDETCLVHSNVDTRRFCASCKWNWWELFVVDKSWNFTVW